MKSFGASAPLKDLQRKFNFSTDAVVDAAKKQVARQRANVAMAEVPVRGVEMNV